MPPRKTTNFGALFEALIAELRIQVAASVDRALGDFSRRLARLERHMEHANFVAPGRHATRIPARACGLCERRTVARGLCSAHYQQWRYRERKAAVPKPRQDSHAAALPESHGSA